jgi:hypothetical protein
LKAGNKEREWVKCSSVQDKTITNNFLSSRLKIDLDQKCEIPHAVQVLKQKSLNVLISRNEYLSVTMSLQNRGGIPLQGQGGRDGCLFRGTTEEQSTPPESPVLFENFFIINSMYGQDDSARGCFFTKQTTPSPGRAPGLRRKGTVTACGDLRRAGYPLQDDIHSRVRCNAFIIEQTFSSVKQN